jgi:hypothetical protein
MGFKELKILKILKILKLLKILKRRKCGGTSLFGVVSIHAQKNADQNN